MIQQMVEYRGINTSMSSKPSTLEQLKSHNSAAHARFLVAVVARTEKELIEPRLPAGWSIKDVLGHLAWWDHWLVYTLFPEHAEIAANPPPMNTELGLDKMTLDELNARVFKHNASQSLAEIRANFARAHSTSAQIAAKLTEADVFDPNARSALIGRSVEELVFGIYEHYEEHAHEIEAAFS
jgi:hypothetical protein